MSKLTEEQKARRTATRRRNEALAAEAEHERQQAKQREWEVNGTRLTRDELDAGAPCRGCGLPIIDGLGTRPPLTRLDAADRAEHDVDEAAYTARHRDCRGHRWTLSGSRTQHCGFCCPPPPLSAAQIAQLSKILSSAGRRDPSELDTWRLTLTCEHTVLRQQHRSASSWTTRVVECPDCNQHRGVIVSERLADQTAGESRPANQQHPRTRAADSAELAKLRRDARKLNQRIEELERTIGRNDPG